VYAEHVLGASGGDLAIIGFIVGPVSVIFGVPVGLWLASAVPRRRLAVLAPVGGAIGAFGHLWVTKLWQSLAIGVVTAPLLVACVVAFAPFALSVIPSSGGMTERVGVLLGPFGMIGVASSYASALAYDHLVHDYRVIWVVAGTITLAIGLVLPRVRVPEGHERADIRGMLRDGLAALRSRLSQRTGLFSGEVTTHDADTTDFVESLRQLAVRYGLDDGTPDGPPLPGTLL
jgi:MFS family permease